MRSVAMVAMKLPVFVMVAARILRVVQKTLNEATVRVASRCPYCVVHMSVVRCGVVCIVSIV